VSRGHQSQSPRTEPVAGEACAVLLLKAAVARPSDHEPTGGILRGNAPESSTQHPSPTASAIAATAPGRGLTSRPDPETLSAPIHTVPAPFAENLCLRRADQARRGGSSRGCPRRCCCGRVPPVESRRAPALFGAMGRCQPPCRGVAGGPQSRRRILIRKRGPRAGRPIGAASAANGQEEHRSEWCKLSTACCLIPSGRPAHRQAQYLKPGACLQRVVDSGAARCLGCRASWRQWAGGSSLGNVGRLPPWRVPGGWRA